MRARTVVITGASSGIGRAAAKTIAASGSHVVLLVRDLERGRAVARDIAEQTGDATRASVVLCDLASFACVREAAATVASEHPTVNVLVNNAGLITSSRQITVDGNETIFQVNHLSHFLLTQLLRPQLVAAGSARVINVSSDSHLRTFAGLDFDDLGMERRWSPFRAYAASKLANVLFTYELSRRWERDEVAANAMHPGVVRSGFGAGGWGAAGVLWERLVPKATPEKGARTLELLAISSELDGVTGRYFFRGRAKRSSPVSYNLTAQTRLWEQSEHLTGCGAPASS